MRYNVFFLCVERRKIVWLCDLIGDFKSRFSVKTGQCHSGTGKDGSPDERSILINTVHSECATHVNDDTGVMKTVICCQGGESPVSTELIRIMIFAF